MRTEWIHQHRYSLFVFSRKGNLYLYLCIYREKNKGKTHIKSMIEIHIEKNNNSKKKEENQYY